MTEINNKAKKELFFDLDGTLTDPGEGITNCVAYALEAMGYPVPPREELYSFIGPPLFYGFTKWYRMDEETANKAIAKYRERFTVTGIFENEIYDGIQDMLKMLKKQGNKLFVVTSKPEDFARRITEHFDLDFLLDDVIGADMKEPRSDKEYIIAKAFLRTGAKKEETVMVGDRKYDMEGAKANGIYAVGAEYGYGSAEELKKAGADVIAASVNELRGILTELTMH